MTTRSAPDRLLSVLAAFDHEHPALRLTDISRRAGLSLTTAHRLAGALTEWGALERDSSGVYRVGLRLWGIAALAVRDGAEVVYIEWFSGRSAVGVHIRAGARRPLRATGVGLALLAHGAPEFQDEYCAGPPASFTPYTIADPVRLRRVLAEVRRTGVAVSSRQVTDDTLSVAAPVRGPGGTVSAAVSVVVPHADARVPVLTPAVRLAARGISRALGWQPDRTCGLRPAASRLAASRLRLATRLRGHGSGTTGNPPFTRHRPRAGGRCRAEVGNGHPGTAMSRAPAAYTIFHKVMRHDPATAIGELGQTTMVIRVQPDEGMTVRFGSKVPGTSMEIRDVTMDFAYGDSCTESSR